MVAPLFFALIFSTFEAGWIMTKQVMLDRSVDKTVRLLRLGAIPNPTQNDLRQRICTGAVLFADCEKALLIELIPIRTTADFPIDQARCVNRTTNVEPTVRFNPGERAEMVFVRVCAVVDPLTPLIGLGLRLPKDASSGFQIISSSAFMNEPA